MVYSDGFWVSRSPPFCWLFVLLYAIGKCLNALKRISHYTNLLEVAIYSQGERYRFKS